MKGLRYIGDHEEGIRVMLFRSYKSVLVTKHQPYTFTANDDVSTEAENYYHKLGSLGVVPTSDEADLVPESNRRAPAKRVQLPEVVVESEQIAAQTKDAEIEEELTPEDLAPPVAKDSSELTNPEVTNSEVTNNEDTAAETTTSSSVEGSNIDVTPDMFAEMTDGELGEYVEMNFERDQIKEIIETLQLDITPGRKGKGTLINEILESGRDKLVQYLANLEK